MKIARAHLESITPYSQSRNIDLLEYPKKNKETGDDYERRVWRARMHVTKDGYVEIPSTVFPASLKISAKRLGLQVPGKGKATYTKCFEAGILVSESLKLPIKAADVPCDRLYVNANGRPGPGSRVWRHFPRIDSWKGIIEFLVFDDLLTEDIFRQVINSAGMLVGIGRFRPENRGFYGRYKMTRLDWIEDAQVSAAAE